MGLGRGHALAEADASQSVDVSGEVHPRTDMLACTGEGLRLCGVPKVARHPTTTAPVGGRCVWMGPRFQAATTLR